jgi:hypothetical protein
MNARSVINVTEDKVQVEVPITEVHQDEKEQQPEVQTK